MATEAWEGFWQPENLILIHSLPLFSFSPLKVLFSPKLVITAREEYFCYYSASHSLSIHLANSFWSKSTVFKLH